MINMNAILALMHTVCHLTNNYEISHCFFNCKEISYEIIHNKYKNHVYVLICSMESIILERQNVGNVFSGKLISISLTEFPAFLTMT